MSDMGAILDAIATAAEGAVSGLVAERGLRLPTAEDKQPAILFLFNPDETIELADHVQEITTTASSGVVYADVTQEVMAGYLDDIRDAIRADVTLGGIVRWAWVSERGIDEGEDSLERAGILTFVAEQEA